MTLFLEISRCSTQTCSSPILGTFLKTLPLFQLFNSFSFSTILTLYNFSSNSRIPYNLRTSQNTLGKFSIVHWKISRDIILQQHILTQPDKPTAAISLHYSFPLFITRFFLRNVGAANSKINRDTSQSANTDCILLGRSPKRFKPYWNLILSLYTGFKMTGDFNTNRHRLATGEEE